MIGYREPGYMWKLPLPMVWGPIGGHAQLPWKYLSLLGGRAKIYHGFRNILNNIQMWSSFRVRRAAKRANVLIAATSSDKFALLKIHNRESILINETGAKVQPKH